MRVSTLAAFGLLTACAEMHRQDATLVSADRASFQELIPGVSRTVLWGNPKTGAYAAFTRFVPGFQHGLHTHTSEIRMVVLQGAYLFRPEGGEMRVAAGSYFVLPAGYPHATGADAAEGALFYEESDGPFDLVDAKSGAAKKGSVSDPVSAAAAPFRAVMAGIEKATLRSDPATGAYCAFTRFAPGLQLPLHTHPNDLRLVGIKGAYRYQAGSVERTVGPRSYFFLPAGVPHAGGTDSREGAVFFESSRGKFDFNPVHLK
jgi:quercetin dioxygenase-like cupin family protein